MKLEVKILNVVKYVGLTILTIGIIIFLLGLFKSGYNILISIGLGAVLGAVLIFLIGVFFVATEEMLDKTHKGIKIVPIKQKKEHPYKRSF